jgi:hypothetical protein
MIKLASGVPINYRIDLDIYFGGGIMKDVRSKYGSEKNLY